MEQAILTRLKALKIPFELYEHPQVLHVSDRITMGLCFDSCLTKNLMVCTRNESRVFLIMARAETPVDLKHIAASLNVSHLGFASDRLVSELDQKAGCIGVLPLIIDKSKHVETIFDISLRGEERVALHPGDNRQTLVMRFSDIEAYVRSCGNRVIFLPIISL